ncbi:MAG: hypothetical protein HOP08_08515 [Cyclobacteriaceae bacterium]|nr:hypothetical protein [Cyclobacteriaceae bacterium]
MSDQALWLKILFLILLFLAFTAYFLTIHHAIANYNVKNFIYSKSSPNNVLKYQKESTNEFKKIEIQDLLYSINQNEFTNNRKADNLIYSYRAFKVGNLLTAILVLILCSSLLFVKNEVESIRIANPIKIENLHQSKQLDSLARELIENLKLKQQLRGSDSSAQIVD